MTDSEKLRIYESFFHRINLFRVTMNNDKIATAISLIDAWSYAHRQGNGALSEEEQNNLINNIILKMEKF